MAYVQDLTGADALFEVDSDRVIRGLPKLDLAPATVYLTLSGQANNAPDVDLALAKWGHEQQANSPVSDLLTYAWPGPGPLDGNRSRRTLWEVSAAAAIVIPTIADPNLLAMGARVYELEFEIRNIGAGGAGAAITLAAAAAGRHPLRYAAGYDASDMVIPFGESLVVSIEYRPEVAIVTPRLIGARIPPLVTRLATATAAGNSSGFDPYLYQADRVLLFALRSGASALTATPAGKGYSVPADAGGLVSGNAEVTSQCAIRMLLSDSRGADGQFGGTGTVTNATRIYAGAWRGQNLALHSYACVEKAAGDAGSDALSFPQFASLPPGAHLVLITLRNLSTVGKPTDVAGETLHEIANASGWSHCMMAFTGLTAFEPDPVAQAACAYITLAAVLVAS